MKIIIILFLGSFRVLVLPFRGNAQTDKDSLPNPNNLSKRDSLTGKLLAYNSNKFAAARPFNIEYTYLSPYKYNSKLYKTSLAESKTTGFSQLKVNANLNFIKRKNWILGGAIMYRYTDLGVDLTDPNSGSVKSVTGQFHYHVTSLNFTYFSRLFDKTTIYTGSLMVDGSDKHFERIKGLATGTIILKANARTKMAAGIVATIDPSVQLPVIPTFTYEHQFSNGMVADLVLPKQMLLRKTIHGYGRLSLGTELDRSGFYLYNLNPNNLSQKYEYRQVDLNSGLTYEHLLGNYFIVTARAGVRTTMKSVVFEKEKTFGDPVYETSPRPGFYFNIGLSFNPFVKKKRQ